MRLSSVVKSVFADGAAGMVISAQKPQKGFEILALETSLTDSGEQDMAWTIGNTGFDMVLSAYVPRIIEAELGNLAAAETYVNMIRSRAKTGSVQDASVNYVVNPYPAGTFAAKGKDYSMNAIYMENRLEFAMEGHRFFDLVRWGIASDFLNKMYIPKEGAPGKDLAGNIYNKRSYMAGKSFDPAKNNFFPLPIDEILNTQKGGAPTLKQNPGY